MHGVQGNSLDVNGQAAILDIRIVSLSRISLVTTFFFALVLIFNTTGCVASSATRPVVKIGLVAPFEGQYRHVGYDAIYAVRLALREVNAAGGVGGYSVELVAYDDQGAIPQARVAARNLALDSQVVGVIGHFLGQTSEAAWPVYAQTALPAADKNMIWSGDAARDVYSALLCPLLEYLKTIRASGTVQWISGRPGEKLQCDRATTLTSVRASKAASDIILLTLDPVAAGETVKDLRKAGFSGLVAGGPTLGSPLFVGVGAEAATDVIFASLNRWPDLDGRDADFAAAYQSVGPHVPPPGPYALLAYQSAKALLAAIETASDNAEGPTRLTVGHHLAQLANETVYLYRWAPSGKVRLIQELTSR